MNMWMAKTYGEFVTSFLRCRFPCSLREQYGHWTEQQLRAEKVTSHNERFYPSVDNIDSFTYGITKACAGKVADADFKEMGPRVYYRGSNRLSNGENENPNYQGPKKYMFAIMMLATHYEFNNVWEQPEEY